MLRQKYKVCCKRNSKPWSEPVCNATEIVYEELLSQPGDAAVVFLGGVQYVRVVAGSAKTAEHNIDVGPPAAHLSHVGIDDGSRFGVQGVVDIHNDLPMRFDDDDAVL